MIIVTIVITGMINIILQKVSRNILFFYVFTTSAILSNSLLYRKTKTGKIFTMISMLLSIALFVVSLYYHNIYGGMMNDYLIIMTETAILTLLAIISILPIKKFCRKKSVNT